MPIHLHPTAELAERVLLPGDPGRALLLANALLERPRMFNHNRGLWGYTGTAADGAPLSIQSTGMGAPSAAIVITELSQLGARRLIRVGTCGALDPDLLLGEVVLAPEAVSADGVSRALGTSDRATADAQLQSVLEAAGDIRSVTVASTDLFYEADERSLLERGAQAVDLETAALFTLARRHDLRAASVLIVSDLIVPSRSRIETEALKEAEHRAGELAASALTSQPISG